MRTFIIRARKAPSKTFNTRDLVKAGRMDLVCRCISNAMWVSDGIRRDVVVKVVLEGSKNGPKVLTIKSDEIKTLNADEQNIADNINLFFRGKPVAGFYAERKSFEELFKEYDNVYLMDKKGTDIREVKFKENPCFLIGDYIGMPEKTQKLLDRSDVERINLSPVMLFASHCIVLIHNELDRIEFGK